jgi:hypothetical protein
MLGAIARLALGCGLGFGVGLLLLKDAQRVL